MAQVLEDRECFICGKNGFKGVKVDLESVGQKADGKPIWKYWEVGTNTEHQHKGQQGKVSNSEINAKLDKILEIVTSLKGQARLDVSSNE